jgi:hypothetical protein
MKTAQELRTEFLQETKSRFPYIGEYVDLINIPDDKLYDFHQTKVVFPFKPNYENPIGDLIDFLEEYPNKLFFHIDDLTEQPLIFEKGKYENDYLISYLHDIINLLTSYKDNLSEINELTEKIKELQPAHDEKESINLLAVASEKGGLIAKTNELIDQLNINKYLTTKLKRIKH